MKVKPIKRHKAIQPLSREHHQGLLLSWKIRTGLSKGVSTDRIKTYADWFYKTYLIPHFEEEEKHRHYLPNKLLADGFPLLFPVRANFSLL